MTVRWGKVAIAVGVGSRRSNVGRIENVGVDEIEL